MTHEALRTPTIPDDDVAARIARRRRARLLTLGFIAISYLLDTVILAFYAAAGTTRLLVPAAYAIAGAVICTVFLGLYRSHVGEQAPDPFLTVAQTVPSVALQLLFLVLAPEVGFVFLTILFIVFGVAAARISLPRAALAWSVTAVGLAVAVALLGHQPAIPVASAAERWISCLCLALTLARCIVWGRVGSRYREVLHERTVALRHLNATLEDQVALRTRELARANEELERLVRQQKAEIRTLQGILPICSHCKKIRDDQGSWNQIEAYISAHTDVLFSHGLCADCLKEHYSRYLPPDKP